MDKLSHAIRKLTIPPVFALLHLLILYFSHPTYIGSVQNLVIAVVCLAVLPTLGYPLQKYIPYFKDRGRNGQRTLAMLFSATGYLLGIILGLATSSPRELMCVYLEYLLCGVAMLVLNRIFKIKASGHACGIIGPVILLLYFRLCIPAAIGLVLTLPVYSSSLKTKRHTASELAVGSVIPIVAIFFAALIAR